MAHSKRKTVKAVIFILAGVSAGLLLVALTLPPVGAPEYYYSMDRALLTPKSVTKLALKDQGLVDVPEEVKELTNLKVLDLVGNQIGELPNWLPQLININAIRLSDNQLASFPPELTNMSHLEDLHLSRNSIDELPPTIGNIKSLQTLFLRDNNLTDMPDEISQLSELTYLDLRGNRLSAAVQEKVKRLLPHARIELGEQRE